MRGHLTIISLSYAPKWRCELQIRLSLARDCSQLIASVCDEARELGVDTRYAGDPWAVQACPDALACLWMVHGADEVVCHSVSSPRDAATDAVKAQESILQRLIERVASARDVLVLVVGHGAGKWATREQL